MKESNKSLKKARKSKIWVVYGKINGKNKLAKLSNKLNESQLYNAMYKYNL